MKVFDKQVALFLKMVNLLYYLEGFRDNKFAEKKISLLKGKFRYPANMNLYRKVNLKYRNFRDKLCSEESHKRDTIFTAANIFTGKSGNVESTREKRTYKGRVVSRNMLKL